jgi:hypothetical protein
VTILQGFRIENGQMRIGVFNNDLPEGWFDSPTKAERAVNPPPPPVKRPTLKLKKARNV